MSLFRTAVRAFVIPNSRYEAYFHPFDSFTPDERDGLRQKLLVAAKMENDYDTYA